MRPDIIRVRNKMSQLEILTFLEQKKGYYDSSEIRENIGGSHRAVTRGLKILRLNNEIDSLKKGDNQFITNRYLYQRKNEKP